jgi:hypothetical protein
MPNQYLTRQLDQEIERAELSVEFWNEQVELQAGNPLIDTVKAIAESCRRELAQLREAREVFRNP